MWLLRPVLQGFYCNDCSLSGFVMQFIVCIGFVQAMRCVFHLQHRETKTAWVMRELRSSVLKMAGDHQATADGAQIPSLQQGSKRRWVDIVTGSDWRTVQSIVTLQPAGSQTMDTVGAVACSALHMYICVISGFCCDVDKPCGPQGYYASTGNPLPTFRNNISVPSSRVKKFFSYWASWPLKMGRIYCREKSVKDYRYTQHNISEDRICYVYVHSFINVSNALLYV
jgi:hypothetical protein